MRIHEIKSTLNITYNISWNVRNVKTLNVSEHDGRDLLNDDIDFMLSQVAENISVFFIEIEFDWL
jgi:hypothetical protein